MNGLDTAVIMEVLSWKIKFTVNKRILLRKSSPKYYFKKCIKNVMKRNLVKGCLVCLFNKFVRFFLEQVPYIIKPQYQYHFSLGLQVTINLLMKVLQNNNAVLRFSSQKLHSNLSNNIATKTVSIPTNILLLSNLFLLRVRVQWLNLHLV